MSDILTPPLRSLSRRTLVGIARIVLRMRSRRFSAPFSVRIRRVRPALSGGGLAGSRTGLTFDRVDPPSFFSTPRGNVRMLFRLVAPAVFVLSGGGGVVVPPTFTIFTPDILACILVTRFQSDSLLREVALEQEVDVIRENPNLLVENAKTGRTALGCDILVRNDGAEEVDDELHGLID